MDTNQNSKRWWDILSALLLIAALVTAASRLAATGWTRNLHITQSISVISVILGLSIGYSRFSSRTAFVLAVGYSIVIIPWQIGNTLRASALWPERMAILINRINVIIYQISKQEVVQDSLLFLVIMSIILWIISFNAGFTLVREGNAWNALIPSGVTILIIHSFDPLISNRIWYLAAFLFFALILVARMTFLHRHYRWQKNNSAMPPHLGLEFIRFTIVSIAILVILAWTIPALANALPAADRAWQPVRHAWYITRDRFDNAFASLNSTLDSMSGYYGKNAVLGRGNPLNDSQIIRVRPSGEIPEGARLYWRARTYDSYKNGQWFSTKTKTKTYQPEDSEIINQSQNGRQRINFSIASATEFSTLLIPPQPMWMDRSALVEYIEYPNGTIDYLTFRSVPPIEHGEFYQIQSSISNPSISQLRQAGTSYPAWISERYLQLPDTITDRTYKLADEITSGLDTPYDKVVAITDYLRQNIKYVDIIDAPPQDQEATDWFLFDYQQGFCNYYSTAEIVLLRAIGIPARWAVGFAQGEQIEDGTYVVKQRDAHAWPEVYFPGIGWVEFEPTQAQPEIVRLEVQPLTDTSSNIPSERDFNELSSNLDEVEEIDIGDESISNQETGFQYERFILTVPLIGGILLILLVWRYRRIFNFPKAPIILEASFIRLGIKPPKRVTLWAKISALPAISKAYMEINNALIRLKNEPAVDDTPFERAKILGTIMPELKTPAKILVDEYHTSTFAQKRADFDSASQAGAEIKKRTIQTAFQEKISRLFTIGNRNREVDKSLRGRN